MTTAITGVSYEIEVDKIETEYSGSVTVSGKEADYQKRRDMEQAGINWKDDTPESRLAQIRIRRAEPRHFEMTLTKDEARGFGIGSRVQVVVRLVS